MKPVVAAVLFVAAFALHAAAVFGAEASEAEQKLRREAFRAFAEPFVGTWDCHIEEWSETTSDKPVWEDRQRRVFAFTMSRQFLEERAWLTSKDGTKYEAGLHLTTFDPQSDRVVQHGFWLPLQPDPLFRIEGRIVGTGFAGDMRIRERDGTSDTRPLVIEWLGRDEWQIRVEDTRADGTKYTRERVVYTRSEATR